jgi:L-amino acid N-acyltransferase YncA
MQLFHIRKATIQDQDAIWNILQPIIKKGAAFAYHPLTTKEEMIAYWCDAKKHTYVALVDDSIAGTFFIQDNQPGLGSHIANAGYAVSERYGAKGLGRFMGVYSLEEAKRLGYTAMQFNLVVKSNEKAVNLWKELQFEVIGEIPDAFHHSTQGPTNAFIMYRRL